jgi:hypothetical protein
VVIDWSLWNGKHFGNAFDPDALKKRRAYKKWAEMLLQPELKDSEGKAKFYHAKLYLDQLKIMYGYDVIEHLKQRFTENYHGESPYIDGFQHADSKKDANQCLQLCDLLTGSLYQALVPSNSPEKTGARDHLEAKLRAYGVKELKARFWKQYASNTLNKHFPKYSAWFWKPAGNSAKRKK